jgi:quinol monooxygenase YgiN
MSSISLILAGLGALVAAVGAGILLARCFRAPRADLIAWSVALLGLLVSLGAQTLGYLGGFDAAMFRAMAMGGLVVAPLAVVLGLSEVAGKGLAARFCARVYLPALAIVALVVLYLDELSSVAFTKSWPDPHVYYQAPPNYVLYLTAVVTALLAVIAIIVVLVRSSQPGWSDVRAAQLVAGLAALMLAYPGLALLLRDEAKISLPLTHVFTPLLAIAAGLVLLAGTRLGQRDIAALHGRRAPALSANDPAGWHDADFGRGAPPGDYGRSDGYGPDDYGRSGEYSRSGVYGRPDEPVRAGGASRFDDGDRRGGYAPDQTGDFDRFDDAGMGVYRDGGPYRPEPALEGSRHRAGGADDDSYDYGWQDRRGDPRDDHDPGFETGGFATGDLDLNHPDLNHSDLDRPDVDHQLNHDLDHDDLNHGEPDRAAELGLAAGAYAAGAYGQGGHHSDGWQDSQGQPAADTSRQDLFGQIAIYTLLEDRVNEFDLLTQRVVEEVRGREPDTLVFIVHAVPSAPMQRILYEVYRDRAAFEWHRQQPYVLSFEADRRPYVLATNVIELGLQQAKVSPFPSVTELFGEPGYDTSGFERPDYLRDYGREQDGHGDSRGGHQGDARNGYGDPRSSQRW